MSAFRDPIAWERSLTIRPSAPAWVTTVRAAWGTLEPADAELFAELSGARTPPDGGSDDLLVVAGRRGGKSETIARVAAFEALHGGHQVALAPGQLGLVAVVSPRREQSQEIIRYVTGLAALPQVKRQVAAVKTDAVEFKTGIAVQVMTLDAVSVVGRTLVCAIAEEYARWPGGDAAHSDDEIIAALRPGLAPLAGAPRRRFIGITSAYIRDGLAYETDRDHYGKDDAPVLVVRGSTALFNPNIDRAWLERERRRVGDRAFAREYLAEWQDAITDGWFGDAVDTSIDKDVTKRPRRDGVRYVVAIDQAFASDRFTVSVAHAEKRDDGPPLLVQDYTHAWKPKLKRGERISVDECAIGVRGVRDVYGASVVYCDQFAIEPLKAVFARHRVTLVERPWTAASKAPTYRLIRDAMTDRRVRLLDVPEQTREFHAIRGELLRSGGERIEAAYGHDDRVSAAVMSLHEAQRTTPTGVTSTRNSESFRAAREALRSQWDGGGGSAEPNPLTETAESYYRRRDREQERQGW